MQNFLALEHAKRGGHMEVRTKGPKAGHLTSECLCIRNRAPDCIDSRSRPADKCCTSVDGGCLPSADVDTLTIHGDI